MKGTTFTNTTFGAPAGSRPDQDWTVVEDRGDILVCELLRDRKAPWMPKKRYRQKWNRATVEGML